MENEELKERILKIVSDHTKNSLGRRDIEELLELKTSSEKIEADRLIDQMEADDELFRDSENRYSDREQNNMISGVIHINKRGIGYIDRDGLSSVLIYEDHQADAMNGDVVLAKVTLEDAEQAYGSAIRVLKRSKDHVIGTFMMRGSRMTFVPDDDHLQNHRFMFHLPEDAHIVDGEKVLFRIIKYGNPLEVEFVKKLGYKDDPGIDILSVLYDYDIDPDFPKDAAAQAEEMEQEVSEEETKGRVDLTGDITVTVDGDDSKDFDDAVSVTKHGEGWTLKVSIADVSHYVTENSPLDIEARKRGCSTYVTDRVVPMLPHLLSNGICSLNPHVIRLTNTCEMEIRHDGSVDSYKVYPSFIRSTERMTYNNANKILDGDRETIERFSDLGSLFTDLRDCADAIRAYRNRKGAIDFDTTESEIIVDEKGFPIDIRPVVRGHAEAMIEDCMIAANVCVADLMNKKGVPCMYRIHEEPQAKRMKDYSVFSYLMGHPFNMQSGVTPKDIQSYLRSVENTEEYPILASQMLRCMQKARYDSKCLGHFGLAEKEYLHFTSPIRRYPDLVVHRMLRKYIYEKYDGDPTADQKRIEEDAEQSSIRERASQSAEFACDDMKKAEYMTGKIGEVYDGLITSVMSYGFYVELENTVEGLVGIASLQDDYYVYDESRMCLKGEHNKKVFQVGQKVRIRVMGASKDERTVDFAIEGMKAKKQSSPGRYKGRSHGAKRDGSYSQRGGQHRSYSSNGKSSQRNGRSYRQSYNSRRGRNGR